MKWWMDAAYAVHPDMKSHTGGAFTLGSGVIYGTSTCQKLNTKSSTKVELVAVNDVLPQVLWTKYFLKAQGYSPTDTVIYQDNQSAILLENNGRAFSSKRTHHLNIRYFFIHDRIESKKKFGLNIAGQAIWWQNIFQSHFKVPFLRNSVILS
jgi:hypothetical protein